MIFSLKVAKNAKTSNYFLRQIENWISQTPYYSSRMSLDICREKFKKFQSEYIDFEDFITFIEDACHGSEITADHFKLKLIGAKPAKSGKRRT